MTPQSFDIRYHNWPSIVNHTYWPNSYAGFTYDAVWAEALALNSSLSRITKLNRSLDDFRYSDSEMAGIFKEEMYRVNFSGISNMIKFDKYGDVHPHNTYLVQQQGNAKRFVATIIAKENLIDFNTIPPNVIKWAGNGPPVDQVKRVYRLLRIPLAIFIIMTILSCIAILIAVAFLIYNDKNRNKRVIKMSSPNLNSLILIGCISLYLSVIASGTISVVESPILCMLPPWLTTIGFAIVSGSMFAKTYRAYKIFTTKKRISVSFSNDSIIVISQLLECDCQHGTIWLVTILALNGFVIIFGAFIAYEARKIKLLIMNESKQIAICIYNVALLCIIVIPITFSLPNTSGGPYITSCGLILYCTTTTICIFFIPKVRHNKIGPAQPYE
ncbi:Gamma-aminobutyric acid type B receptor subunit 2 [Trichoplax sp. H2]|nr:Gamma-aminobutyric acid type B receptor subunit 2 [Trichoplax sp. H2]|eukprot:RDD36044.1 Gamma-aminobutyric acid type B receptor subunit 2 [Trichoplax sp. H2]